MNIDLKTKNMDTIKIKEVENIIAIEILLNTYKIDVLKYTIEEIKTLIELLNQIEKELPKLKEKAILNQI